MSPFLTYINNLIVILVIFSLISKNYFDKLFKIQKSENSEISGLFTFIHIILIKDVIFFGV